MNINKIGVIDSVCSNCHNRGLTVYAGPPESYPHGAEKVCECGHREKANSTEIHYARLAEDEIITESVEVIEDEGITCFVVPDSVVEYFQLRPGDKFIYTVLEDGKLVIKPEIDRINN